jgi:2-oxoglutarate ferredoxin oxidoreductase subunit delta
MAARGSVKIDAAECKGCGVCVEACPPKCLKLEPGLNHYGVHPAYYLGEGCTGCGICFYTCPEPGAITVYRAVVEKGPDKTKTAPAKQASEMSPAVEALHAATV